jgi:hypothetical protein
MRERRADSSARRRAYSARGAWEETVSVGTLFITLIVSKENLYLANELVDPVRWQVGFGYRSDGAGFGAGSAAGGAGGSGTPSSFAWNSMIFCNIS